MFRTVVNRDRLGASGRPVFSVCDESKQYVAEGNEVEFPTGARLVYRPDEPWAFTAWVESEEVVVNGIRYRTAALQEFRDVIRGRR